MGAPFYREKGPKREDICTRAWDPSLSYDQQQWMGVSKGLVYIRSIISSLNVKLRVFLPTVFPWLKNVTSKCSFDLTRKQQSHIIDFSIPTGAGFRPLPSWVQALRLAEQQQHISIVRSQATSWLRAEKGSGRWGRDQAIRCLVF